MFRLQVDSSDLTNYFVYYFYCNETSGKTNYTIEHASVTVYFHIKRISHTIGSAIYFTHLPTCAAQRQS